MGSIYSVVPAVVMLVAAPAFGQQNPEMSSIKALLTELYKQPLDRFAYADGVGKTLANWRSYYEKYYTNDIVKQAIENISKERRSPWPIVVTDPRFIAAGGTCAKILKLTIGTPWIQGDTASVLVDYTVYDGMDKIKCTTEYLLRKTQAGWRISDQWLGQANYKNDGHKREPNLLSDLKSD